MKPLKLIITSIKETIDAIRKNWFLFIILLILQGVFIVSLTFVQINYQLKIMENSKFIMDYFQALNLDGEELSEIQNALGENPLQIYTKFKELLLNITLLITFTVMLILFFNPLNWAITENMLNRLKVGSVLIQFWKLFLINLVYLTLIGVVLFIISRRTYLEYISRSGIYLFIPLVAIIVILYFLFISLSLSREKLGIIPYKSFLLGVKHSLYILPLYFIILLILSALSLFLFWLQNNLTMAVIVLIIFFSCMVFCRIFFITSIRKLNSNYSELSES